MVHFSAFMVKIFVERERSELTEDYSGPVLDLLLKIGVNPETIVVVKNGEVVSEDEEVSGDDELKLLSVISGG